MPISYFLYISEVSSIQSHNLLYSHNPVVQYSQGCLARKLLSRKPVFLSRANVHVSVHMATRNYQFGFHTVELFKEDTLGTGSYGGVCRARCDGLPCAAKIMHPTLFDLRDPGTVSYLCRFEEECRLLSSARHPNVVQYLCTYRDPETRLSVLLMELCDESLCRFLERCPRPVAYHTQLNIAHDTALALVYLHLNSLTHRDLTSNNVLMIAGTRAKVTDFGMSKLACVNPRTTPMTLCPGNIQYMSPEALEEPPSYTEKLDIFSYGVLLVQIMTRQFPDPGPRFRAISLPDYPEGTIKMAVPETQRRASHLKLIQNSNPLKGVAIHCLKDKEGDRPTAQQLNTLLCELKQAMHYTESLQQVKVDAGGETDLERLQCEVRDLQQEVQTQQEEIADKEQELLQTRGTVEEKERENKQLQVERDGFETQLGQMRQQLHEQRLLTEAKTREVVKLQSALQEKESKMGEKDVQSSENLKAKTQDTFKESATGSTVARKGINKDMKWENGEKAPEIMCRGSTVVHGNTVFINPQNSKKMYSCQVTAGSQQWSTLPDSTHSSSSLAIVDDVPTSVGGAYTNTLLSLTGRETDGKREWTKSLPPMPTSRSDTVSITTKEVLIVAGGYDGEKNLDTVEVMEIPTQQWSVACRLPHRLGEMSGTLCGDRMYFAGGYDAFGDPSNSVFTCSLPDLLSSRSLGGRLRSLFLANKAGVWKQVRDLPATLSTIVTLRGHVLAIGGTACGDSDDSVSDTAAVYWYHSHADNWIAVSEMRTARNQCLAAVLPDARLFIVGGCQSASVELGKLLCTFV